MGLWSRLIADAYSPTPAVKASETFPSSAVVYDLTTGRRVDVAGVSDMPVTRAQALSVPAVLRVVSLKATTVAGLSWERIDAQGRRIDPGWIEQPEPGRPGFATFTDLGYDLQLDGRAYLRVWERDANRAPRFGGCEYVDLTRTGEVIGPDGRVTLTIDGRPVPREDIIGFHGWHDGIRNHGARTIRIALALEAAARRFADTPSPAQVLINQSDDDLDDDEIDALLADYKSARNQEAVGYLNRSVKLEQVGFDPKALQLVEARQFMNTQLANVLEAPAWIIAGAQAADGGGIYANQGNVNRILVDYGLKQLVRALETRLSMSDASGRAWDTQVTPRGTVVRKRMDDLLRGNAKERAEVLQILIGAGVITPEQAAVMEDLAPEGRPSA